MKFIILGAGLSGLSCGIALAGNGHDVTIVEKEKEAGGLARTFRSGGYAFDYGPHYLFGPKIAPLLRDVLTPSLELMQVKRNQERMYFKGKYFKFPFEPKNLFFRMDPVEAVLASIELVMRRILSGGTHGQDVEDWVIQAVGKRIYEYTSLGGYIEKLYGLPPREISKVWGIQKLKFLSRLQNSGVMSVLRKALGEKKQLAGQVVHYPRTGIDQLAIHLTERFLEAGGQLHLSAAASGIENKGDSVSVACDGGQGQYVLDGDFLVSTIPVHVLLDIFHLPSHEMKSLVDALRYRATLLLFLRVNKKSVMDYQCVYFTDDVFPFRRITEFKNLDSTMAPEDHSSLCVEVTCFQEEAIYRWPKEKLLNFVIDSLEKGGYVTRAEVDGYDLLRIPHAYPVYDLSHERVLVSLLDFLSRFQTMITFGRQGLFSYNNMSHSIISGYELGQDLSSGNGQGWKKLIHRTYEQRKEKYDIPASNR